MCVTATSAQEFIGCRTSDGWAETPMLRTTFHVDAGDLTETAFRSCYYGLVVTSLGYHEVYVNDTKVGDRVMQPAVSQLDKRALWVEYDITPYLHEGNNELLLWIGQGWGRIYGTPAAVQATVRKSVSDGECGLIYEILKTDSTWDASASPYSYTGNWQPMQFGGERYDARVKERWRLAAVYDAKDISVTRQEFEGNRIVDTVRFQAFELEPDSSLVIDFGRVVTGWFAAVFVPHNNPAGDDEEVPLPAGTEVTMVYLDHRDAKPPFTETDIYISDGKGRDIFRNRFHMHSFRYVRIKGAGLIYARALQISAVDPYGGATFECSDPRLNAIHDMVKHTLSCLTFSGYMVDCPHIERMGYGGDGNSSTNTLQTLWDVRSTYANWMQAWHDAMQPDGDLPYVAPAFRTGGGPYWSGFIIKAPYRTWLNYGDRSLINEHYNEMCRWLDFVEKHCEDGILKPWPDTERRAWFLGDWAVPELWSATLWSQGVDKGGESVLHVSNCFLAECLSDMVQMARLMGRNADAERFAAWRERLVKDIHRHFYHPETHTYANGTVLDQCYAMLQGIPPDGATAAAVKAQLLNDIHGKYRDHIAVGLVGVPIFTEWCVRERQADLMATILRQEDYPGYLYMIKNSNLKIEDSADAGNNSQLAPQGRRPQLAPQGRRPQFSIFNSQFATTWESWDCGRPGKEDRSRVHNCYNGIGIWFYQAVAGIRPDLHESREESKLVRSSEAEWSERSYLHESREESKLVRSSEVEWSERSYPEHPGYKHFFIDPQPVDGIEWVRATKPTQYGVIKVEIKNRMLKVEVPQGTTATVFPGTPKERTVGAGVWTYEL